MDEFIELYEKLEKGYGLNAIKGGIAALALMHGAHYMDPANKEKLENKDIPQHARSTASIEHDNRDQTAEQARTETQRNIDDIMYRNQRKSFVIQNGDKLSPNVYKQTIKNNPDLNDKFGYINKLSSSAFKEVTEKNGNLRSAIHDAHYDKLHGEFNGDENKIKHAWENGIKSTHKKFGSDKIEKPNTDNVATPEEPNFTHRRMFRSGRR
jgi:hypothetical protein